MFDFAMLKTYRAAGLVLIPIVPGDANKNPAVPSWSGFRTTPPSDELSAHWAAQGFASYGLLTGAASGNLVAIDFDDHASAYPAWRNNIAPELFDKLVLETSRSGGLHAYVRLAHQPGGSEKFARKADGHVLIETRAEGGYCICAPSIHQQMIQGRLTDIPVLTDAEYDQLVAAAKALDETPPPSVPAPRKVWENSFAAPLFEGTNADGRPGDIYNRDGLDHFKATLQKLGWTFCGVSNGEERWQRPGKDGPGSSATLRDGCFYNFSTSADIPANRGYSLFSAYTQLVHHGSFAAAAKQLADEGFREKTAAVVATESVELPDEGDASGEPEEVPPVDPDLLDAPGLIHDVAAWTDSQAPRRNATLARTGATALVGHLAGLRRCRDPYDGRPNLYLIAAAPSGAGKNAARKTSKKVLSALKLAHTEVGQIASGPALEDALLASPKALYCDIDEVAKLFGAMRAKENFLSAGLASNLLNLYSESDQTHVFRRVATRGRQKPNNIPQTCNEPHVTLHASGIVSDIFANLTPTALKDGLLGRCLLFDSEEASPLSEVQYAELPNQLMARLRTFVAPALVPPLLPFHSSYGVEEHIDVPQTDEALQFRRELRKASDEAYLQATEESERALRSRVYEKCAKLALIFAVSRDPLKPVIAKEDLERGWKISVQSTDRILFLATTAVAETEFQALALRVKDAIRRYGRQHRRAIPRSALLRAVHEEKMVLDRALETLVESHEILVCAGSRQGALAYKLR